MRAWVSLIEKTLRAQIAVVIPALNPTSNFSQYVAELVEAGFSRIVVVDDGSSPDFQKIFLELDQSKAVTVLRHEKNKGQGASLKTAYSHLIADSGDLVNPGGWSIGTPLDEADVWTVKKDAQTWQQELSAYDFVLVYSSSESFENEFGPLFSETSKIAANSIYEVIEENGQLTLTQLP